jgi:hypothetical protein
MKLLNIGRDFQGTRNKGQLRYCFPNALKWPKISHAGGCDVLFGLAEIAAAARIKSATRHPLTS